MREIKVRWRTYRGFQQDAVFVSAIQYVVDGERIVGSRQLHADGQWVEMEPGGIVEPALTIRGDVLAMGGVPRWLKVALADSAEQDAADSQLVADELCKVLLVGEQVPSS